ncbi:MAG: RNA-binding protein [Gammaproteobacteria bacterium]|jgi:ribosome-associated heat shock protein Hsp15|nr:RNA-binding protein [Gammaproteobacteria bacterium]
MEEDQNGLRIDLWLHRCRFFKTRGQATAAVLGGHVRLNGQRTSPGTRVKPDDRIDLIRDRLPYALSVIATPTRRGPAAEARACYEEDEAIAEQREEQIQALKKDRLLAPRTDGRPDKHTRRKLIKQRRT